MRFSSFENFVFIPDSANTLEGSLYELMHTDGYAEPSFVLLPYQNPHIKKPRPEFYTLKNKIRATPAPSTAPQKEIQLNAGTSKSAYIKNVTALKNQIQQGNIYEINYCLQFYAEEITIDPLSVFAKLHTFAKAPYAALLKTGNDFIISASPELFLKKEGDLISTKPIKGTIRRGKTTEEDEQLKNELHTSLKERTENVMAVDVARNDLSMFAKKGTVHVNKLYNIETFETVHQMVSTVSCGIKENTSFETILDATFPMASMTGAPKLRAMQLIDQFEDFERNSYSGAMGLIDAKGDFSLSVIIRSIFYNQQTKKLSISVGGAITYLCDPVKEYEECLLKANALLNALNAKIS